MAFTKLFGQFDYWAFKSNLELLVNSGKPILDP